MSQADGIGGRGGWTTKQDDNFIGERDHLSGRSRYYTNECVIYKFKLP